MSVVTSRPTFRVIEPNPYGDVTLVPAMASGRSEAEAARAMAQALIKAAPASSADALKHLRSLFPHSPLSLRVAALAAAIRR
ncbi:MAG: hypothetical protein ABUL48_01155 [Pseudorhodoplanes sp.]